MATSFAKIDRLKWIKDPKAKYFIYGMQIGYVMFAIYAFLEFLNIT